MMLKRALNLIIVTVLLSKTIKSQNILGQVEFDYSSKAPEVASMQKVVGVPVNNFIGSTGVSIPLHNVRSKSITIPISLDYSGGGGIKVEDNSGRFGVGWSLQAGGMITRQIRGMEDEGGSFEDGPRKRYTPSYPAPGVVNWTVDYVWDSERDSIAQTHYNTFGEWNGMTYDGLVGLRNEIIHHNQDVDQAFPFFSNTAANKIKYGILDSEPDLYYFNFGGYSGKFVFNAIGEAILTPYIQDLRIERVIETRRDSFLRKPPFWTGPADNEYVYFVQKCLVSFKITTPDGLIYQFGLNENDRAETEIHPNSRRKLYNAWALSRVDNKTQNDSVTFSYISKGESTSYNKNRQIFITALSYLIDNCYGETPLTGTQYNYMPRLITIHTSTEEVSFSHEPNGTFLSVKDKNSGKVYRKISKTLDFGVSGKFRLKLISDKDLVTNQGSSYQFSYYDNATFNGPNAQDAWGFYNGAVNALGMMPAFSGCPKDVDRMAKWPEMQQDILTAITYPTGGNVLFEYEPHQVRTGRTPQNYIQESDAYIVQGMPGFTLTNIIGGVRIKTIKTVDPFSHDTLFKNFSYNLFGSPVSSGHLYMAPALYSDLSGFACAVSGNPVAQLSRNNMFIGTGTGLHVGYRNVTVWEGKNKTSNGYTEIEYYDDTNTDSTFFSNAMSATTNTSINDTVNVYPSWQYKLLPENYLSGKEKERKVYNGSGGLLQKDRFIYQSKVYQGFNNYVRGATINALHSDEICTRNYGWGSYPIETTAYFFYYDEEEGHFKRDTSIMNHTVMRPGMRPFGVYYFMYHYTISKNAVLLSRQIKESYASNGVTAIDTIDYLYENDKHVNPTTVITRNSNNDLLKQRTFYALDYNDVNAGDSTFYFMRRAFYNPAIASFSYKNDLIQSGGYRQNVIKSRIDSTVFLPSEEFTLLSPLTGITPSTLGVSVLNPQTYNYPGSYFSKTGSYKYNTDNSVSHVIKKGEDKVVFLWDYDRRFVTAQVVGADSADIAYTSFETTYRGNWTMGSSVVNSANFLTGEKSYQLSNGNISKSGLNATKRYIVSYWSLSGPAIIASTTPVVGQTVKNGWTYYEHQLPASATAVSIGGTVIIDELRLFPIGAQMQTSAFEPMFGISTSMSANNQLISYEYTGMGELSLIRDANNNILKKAEKSVMGFGHDTAIWIRVTGIPRQKKCLLDTNYLSSSFEVEYVNINANSPTFDQKIWQPISDCPFNCVPPDWQNTVNVRCAQNGSSQNTGVQEQEQKDINPCSPTYNQTRWITIGTNLTACPLPPPPCSGPDKKMVGGVCVTGTKKIIAVTWDAGQGMFKCIYKYYFSPDCSTSAEYFDYSPVPCNLSSPCYMD